MEAEKIFIKIKKIGELKSCIQQKQSQLLQKSNQCDDLESEISELIQSSKKLAALILRSR